MREASKERVIVVDLDGTLCDTSSVLHFVKDLPKGQKNYDAFHEGSRDCPPIPMVQQWIAEQYAAGAKIVIATGRKEKWRELSAAYIAEHMPQPYIAMYMCGNSDHRGQVEFKSELIHELVEKYDVVGAIEDRQAVIDVWNELGIPVVHVPGESFVA